jgi:hypothetical protein
MLFALLETTIIFFALLIMGLLISSRWKKQRVVFFGDAYLNTGALVCNRPVHLHLGDSLSSRVNCTRVDRVKSPNSLFYDRHVPHHPADISPAGIFNPANRKGFYDGKKYC